MAIRTDGSLWGWGFGLNGEIGDGILVNRLAPVQIMDNVVAVSAGAFLTAAVRADGSLWTWGSGGAVGDGTNERRINPTRIMDDVVAVSIGG